MNLSKGTERALDKTQCLFICQAGNAGDVGSIPGSGRSLGEEMATHYSIFTWEIPWTEEPGGLQRIAKSDTTEVAEPNSKLKLSVVSCIFFHQLFSGHSHSEVSLGSRR